jgi:phage host-nuclease inhibitor protein Gam
MSRTKTRGANLPVPQNKDDAARAVQEIGTTDRQIARMEADLNDAIAEMKRQAEALAQPLRERRDAVTEGLKVWAEANRDKLTDGGRVKSADLGTGKISWRFRPPSARVTKVEAVLEHLKKLGLQRFIRVKEEPNKDAMLAEPDVARTVAGVTIGSEGEDFIVEPFEVELAAGKAVA